ncbi:peptide deformylase [Scatolibacter rhodanostii]|uniref:peptide deformylase n=1 Tax=Scatolibacter rhodanostii TaxID=2014781 RepID=UPI000C076CB9|nr:peptide deformylase [Scatolibacter rhodanostii]
MAIRNIVQDGDPILKKKSRLVEKFDDRLHQLLEDMKDTLTEAKGAGLAAVQVGVLRQVCIIDVEEDEPVIELINPVILEEEGCQNGAEGCLSFPGQFGLVKRPMKVTVRAQDRNGNYFEKTAEGFAARAFSHEIDHLHGITYDTKVSRMLTEEELESGEYEIDD